MSQLPIVSNEQDAEDRADTLELIALQLMDSMNDLITVNENGSLVEVKEILDAMGRQAQIYATLSAARRTQAAMFAATGRV